MAKDVAARDLDQTGHRIANLGDPKDPADATKVDTKSVPKPAYESGSPGTSLMAAAADHVHPATGGGGAPAGTITLSDPSVQSADAGLDVIWAQAVDFTDMPGDKVRCSIAAIVRAKEGATGKLELRIGGDDDKPDGTPVTAIFTSSESDEVKRATADIPKPSGAVLVKLVASIASAPGAVIARGKEIQFKSI